MNNCFNCKHFDGDMEGEVCHLRESCWGSDLIRGHYWERRPKYLHEFIEEEEMTI